MVAAMGNVLKTLTVCEAVSVHQPIGVRDLAREIDMPKSTVQRALETLLAAGWLVRSEGGRWSLSLRCALIGGRAGQAAALRDLARPAMERLREITDESVRLWARDGDRIVLLENMESRQAVRSVLQPGGITIPLHASAAGKAMLARLPEHEVDELLAQPLAALTPQTITDPAVLREQLRAIRRKGYAETHREAWKDVGAVAAAIHDPSGRPVAAIALALPMHRLTQQLTRRYGKAVAAAAEALSTELAGTVDGSSGTRSRPA
jgi:IclR family transcriptional regulator, acetate operon repressor